MNPNQPMLLTFQLDAKQSAALRVICLRHGIQYIPIPTVRYHETLAMLCGDETPDASPYTGEALAEPMMLFSNFGTDRISPFLAELKRAKCARPQLMAILTETNRAWTPGQLQEQLSEEREMVRVKMQSIHERSGHTHGVETQTKHTHTQNE